MNISASYFHRQDNVWEERMEKLIIIGLSTNARHVYEFVKDYDLYDIVGFAVNREYLEEKTFKGLPVYALEDLGQSFDRNEVKLFAALLWNRLNADRKQIFDAMTANGWKFANLISPHARIRGSVDGTNVWIHDFVVIQNDTVIKDDVAIMGMSLVGANCVIESHCFLGAGSTIGGGSTIGSQSFVGMKCTVFDSTTVGKKCILGACTAVKRNVPDFSLYKTGSDFEIRSYTEDEIEQKLMFRQNKR